MKRIVKVSVVVGTLIGGAWLVGACSSVPELASLPLSEDEFAREWASVYCAARSSCECSVPTDSACESLTLDSVRTASSEASAAGLYYNHECAERLLAARENAGCSSLAELAADSCELCAVYHGERGEGDACEPVSLTGIGVASECAQNLLCVDSVCSALCGTSTVAPLPDAQATDAQAADCDGGCSPLGIDEPAACY